MRRLLIALVLIALGVALFACANGNAPGVSDSTTQSGAAVSIHDSTFDPPTLVVPAATQVRWANNDSTAHQIVANDGSFDSGSLAEGRAFRFTFSKAGTYAYHCAMHPSETGTITVK